MKLEKVILLKKNVKFVKNPTIKRFCKEENRTKERDKMKKQL
jgi:hypothetical protein